MSLLAKASIFLQCSFIALILQTGTSLPSRASLSGLIYIKDLPDESQIISWATDKRSVVHIPQTECFVLSPSGNYLAVSSKSKPDVLKILRIDGSLISVLVWNPSWKSPCVFSWITESKLMISASSQNMYGASSFYTYDLASQTLDGSILPSRSGTSETLLPDLTFASSYSWLGPDMPLYMNAPIPNLYVYVRSVEGMTNKHGYKEISSQVEIYDSATKQHSILEDTGVVEEFIQLLNGFSWSSSGRYLAYVSTDNPPILKVYDRLLNQYWDTLHDFPSPYNFIDIRDLMHIEPFTWSSDEKMLANWVYNPQRQCALGIYNHETNQFSVLHPICVDRIPLSLRWSPDDQAVIYLRNNHDLVFLSMTDDSMILDRDVALIWRWNADGSSFEESFVAHSIAPR